MDIQTELQKTQGQFEAVSDFEMNIIINVVGGNKKMIKFIF